MKAIVVCLLGVVLRGEALYDNVTLAPAERQLLDFRKEHPKPIGVLTTNSGEPLDIIDTLVVNTFDVFENKYHYLLGTHFNRERIPERVVHAKGYGAYGYFEVINDVSKYTKADVFNGIGKKTPVVVRFSSQFQNIGGNDLVREVKGIAIKFYTRQGNLDITGLHIPIFVIKDPIDFPHFVRAFKRNPKTGLFDNTMRWDFMTLRPDLLHAFLWLMSDLTLGDGYRKMNYFALHTYPLYNKKGERYFVKFNLRTEIGLYNLTNAEASTIVTENLDYYNADLYNAISKKNYPAWILEMDILTEKDLTTVDYNPFDITSLWQRGTYRTVPIGRLVLNRVVDNNFKDIEQSGFIPNNLVPGIGEPPDTVFKARKILYEDALNYRLGANHAKIRVNAPVYEKSYIINGVPPVLDNMKDAPNYYPNSFNGPMPYIEENRPRDRIILLHKNAVDLQPPADYYNEIVKSDAHRQRIADNLARTLVDVVPDVVKKALQMITLVDIDLGWRVRRSLRVLKAAKPHQRQKEMAECIFDAMDITKP